MTEYGRRRRDGRNGAEFAEGWDELGDANGRIESRPPEGVELGRAERRALRLVEIVQRQAEVRSWGGSRLWRGCGCRSCVCAKQAS